MTGLPRSLLLSECTSIDFLAVAWENPVSAKAARFLR